MALSSAAEEELNRLNDILRSLGKSSHHTPQDYSKAVATFMRLCRQGEAPAPDDVSEWALANGWSQEYARDLGEMADTVEHVMRLLQNPTSYP